MSRGWSTPAPIPIRCARGQPPTVTGLVKGEAVPQRSRPAAVGTRLSLPGRSRFPDRQRCWHRPPVSDRPTQSPTGFDGRYDSTSEMRTLREAPRTSRLRIVALVGGRGPVHPVPVGQRRCELLHRLALVRSISDSGRSGPPLLGNRLLLAAVFFPPDLLRPAVGQPLPGRPDQTRSSGQTRRRRTWSSATTRSSVSHAGKVRLGVAALFGLIAGANTSAQWETWLLFRNGGDFGMTDPQFGRDVGFYVFRLPFWTFVVDWLFAAMVLDPDRGRRRPLPQRRDPGGRGVERAGDVGGQVPHLDPARGPRSCCGPRRTTSTGSTSSPPPGVPTTGPSPPTSTSSSPPYELLAHDLAVLRRPVRRQRPAGRLGTPGGRHRHLAGVPLRHRRHLPAGLPADPDRAGASPSGRPSSSSATSRPPASPTGSTRTASSRSSSTIERGLNSRRGRRPTPTCSTNVPVVDPEPRQRGGHQERGRARQFYQFAPTLDVDRYDHRRRDPPRRPVGPRPQRRAPVDESWEREHVIFTHGNGVAMAAAYDSGPVLG